MLHDQHLDRARRCWYKPKSTRTTSDIRGRLLLSDCVDQVLILALLGGLLRIDGLQLLVGRDGLTDLAQVNDRHQADEKHAGDA